MAYDLEEQEQIDTLKAWWKQYGNAVTWAAIIALSSFAAWTAWTNYQQSQSKQAAALYEEMERSVAAKDNAKVQAANHALVEKFGKTSYATMSSLTAAKSAYDANDVKTAKAQLSWVIDHSSVAELKMLAKLRLSAILLDEKNYDAALAAIAGHSADEFAADFLDRKADIFVAQNKIAEARDAYQQALAKMGEKHAGRQLVQIKLDAIGGAAESSTNKNSDKK